MKVLIYGGAGFIGPRIMKRILNQGHEVYCFDLNSSSPLIADIKDKIHFIRGDVTLMDDVYRAMVEAKPDRVLHLAYLLGVRYDGVTSEQDPHYAVRLNIMGTDNVFEAARVVGIKRVTYASSLVVYGRQSFFGERPLTEADLRLGSGIYPACKVFNEHQADWYNNGFKMKIVGVRPVNITGPDKVRGSMDHVQCITLPARGLAVEFPFKDSMRVVMHVDDISEIFTRITLAESPQFSVYNAGGQTVSLGGLADMVKEFLPDAKITFQKEQGGKEASGNYMMDATRMTNEFHYTPAPFRQRVKEIINDVRKDAGLPPVN
jgi:nucleoside-diphosphate-sugar epimerase